MIEINENDSIEQVSNTCIYINESKGLCKYDLENRTKDYISNKDDNVIYMDNCRICWKENEIRFLYLNSNNELGKIETEKKIDGLSKL